jgi:hypothetical protein
MVRRSRIRAILLLPLGLLLFIFGWGLYNLGNKKVVRNQKIPPITAKKVDGSVELGLLPPDMQQIPA